MDNMVWLAETKEQLEVILQMAESFYKFAEIKMNPSKFTLATTNQEPNNEITYNNEQMKSIDKKELFKILGC
ncbi:7967_t:CDS:1, partial [Gigaspora rosea]